MIGRQTVKQRIRDTARTLKDVDRGATVRRAQSRQKAQGKYDDAWRRTQYRYQHDRDALLAERSRPCSFCDQELPPQVIAHPTNGGVFVVERERCGCDGERLHLALEADRQAEAERQFEAAEWLRALSRAGLVGWLVEATFDSYHCKTDAQRQCKHTTRQFCDAFLQGQLEERPWLVLFGAYGAGKTHLAAAVIHEAMTAGWRSCYFRPWSAYLERLKNSFAKDAQERTATITRELAAGRLVVIDDLDSDKARRTSSGFAEAELFNALNARYLEGLPTILTFNRPLLELADQIGPALVDRIMGYQFAAVEFRGESHRSGLTLDVPAVAQRRR